VAGSRIIKSEVVAANTHGQLGARVDAEADLQSDVNRKRVAVELREHLSVGVDRNGMGSQKSWSSPANDPMRAEPVALQLNGVCCDKRAIGGVDASKDSRASAAAPAGRGTDVSAFFSSCGER